MKQKSNTIHCGYIVLCFGKFKNISPQIEVIGYIKETTCTRNVDFGVAQNIIHIHAILGTCIVSTYAQLFLRHAQRCCICIF